METETTKPSRPATISRRTAIASAGVGFPFSALPFGTRRMAMAQTGGPADLIFRGGTIVTVDEALPTAEAVAVAGGRIIAAGTEAEVMALATNATRIVDLAGAALLPGFIDSHGHFMNALKIVNWVNVSGPPVGPVSSIADAVAADLVARAVPAKGYVWMSEAPDERHLYQQVGRRWTLVPDGPWGAERAATRIVAIGIASQVVRSTYSSLLGGGPPA